MKYKNKSWLEIAEYASLASSAAGTIVAIASQQVAYAAAPLTLALSLSMINRQKFQQQMQLHNSRAIAEVHQIVESLNQQIHALPTEPANLNPITQSLEQLEHKIQELTQQSDTRLEPQEIARIKNQLNALALQLNNLQDTIEPTDLSGIEADIANLQAHLQAIDSSSGTRIDQLQNQIEQIGQQIQDLPLPFDPSALKQEIANLQQHLEQLSFPPKPFDPTALKLRMEEIAKSLAHLHKRVATDIVSVCQELSGEIEAQYTSVLSRLESLEAIDSSLVASAIAQLQTDLPALEHNTQEAIVQLTNQLGSLALRLDNLPIPLEPVDLSEIEEAIANLNYQLSSLTQQFDNRPEATEVQHLSEAIASAIQRLGELEQQQNLTQLSETQQQLEDLGVSVNHLHNYTQQLKHDLEGQINQLHQETSVFDERSQMLLEIPKQLEEMQGTVEGLDSSTEALHDRTRNLDRIEQQMENLQHLNIVLNEKVEQLHNRIPRLNGIQQNLTNLQQSLTEYVKVEELDNLLCILRKELLDQTDVTVEKQVVQFNQLLKGIQPNYKYELLNGRCMSRNVLLEALQQAKHRLILVCPWLTSYGVDSQVIQQLELLLQSNVYIDIGWGHLKDIDKLGVCSSSIRQKLKVSSDYYNALSKLEALEQKYSARFKLKLLGTHEKFIVCDNCFAMLGSHNFLTSDDRKAERELGLKTNDPYIISELIKQFDGAKNLELITSNINLISASNELDEVDIYF